MSSRLSVQNFWLPISIVDKLLCNKVIIQLIKHRQISLRLIKQMDLSFYYKCHFIPKSQFIESESFHCVKESRNIITAEKVISPVFVIKYSHACTQVYQYLSHYTHLIWHTICRKATWLNEDMSSRRQMNILWSFPALCACFGDRVTCQRKQCQITVRSRLHNGWIHPSLLNA